MKSLNEMEELKRFQGSTFDAFFKEKNNRRSRYYPRTHWQDTGIAEINCMNDSRDFKDAESVHSGQSHVIIDHQVPIRC